MTTLTADASAAVSSRPGVGTRAMLLAGVIAGPLFLATVLIQAATRTGFDTRLHPLSLLSLGDAGWIQQANFILAGVLILASAIGIRQRLRGRPAGTWGPILIGVYGLSMWVGGFFTADPAMGFPVGVPEPSTLSWHSILHAFAAPLMALSLFAACFVFARAYVRQGKRGSAIFSWVVAPVYLALGGPGIATGNFQLVLAGGGVLWLWASFVTAQLMSDTTGN